MEEKLKLLFKKASDEYGKFVYDYFSIQFRDGIFWMVGHEKIDYEEDLTIDLFEIKNDVIEGTIRYTKCRHYRDCPVLNIHVGCFESCRFMIDSTVVRGGTGSIIEQILEKVQRWFLERRK